jgi:hypothetical protein
MNRRSFLKLFTAAGPVAAVAPTYFFAPVGGWKSDVIIDPFSYQVRFDKALQLIDDYMERVNEGIALADPQKYLRMVYAEERKNLWLYGNNVTYARAVA